MVLRIATVLLAATLLACGKKNDDADYASRMAQERQAAASQLAGPRRVRIADSGYAQGSSSQRS